MRVLDMNYAKESQFEQVKEVMSHRMVQLKLLLTQIEDMKRKISLVQYDETIPFVSKTETLQDMKHALLQSMNFAIELMQEEVESNE
jgi:hypothetical protein